MELPRSDFDTTILNHMNSMTVAEAKAWALARIRGNDPYYPDTTPSDRDLLIEKMMQLDGVIPRNIEAIREAVFAAVMDFAQGNGWREPTEAIPLLRTAGCVLRGTFHGAEACPCLAKTAEEQSGLGEIHVQSMHTVIELGHPGHFSLGYLQALYTQKITSLPQGSALRADYESAVVQGLFLRGTVELLAWIPSIGWWSPAVDFHLDAVFGLMISCYPKEWLAERARSVKADIPEANRASFAWLLERNGIP